jgi:hypothetical protein
MALPWQPLKQGKLYIMSSKLGKQTRELGKSMALPGQSAKVLSQVHLVTQTIKQIGLKSNINKRHLQKEAVATAQRHAGPAPRSCPTVALQQIGM